MTVRRAAIAALLLLVCAAYANHFQNSFHFDDDHAIVNNPFVRSVTYVPRYFVDATTASVLPLNRTYRPVSLTTFAIDYRLSGGAPLAFQVDTFCWFLLLLLVMLVLFRRLTAGDAPAIGAVAVFGLHPAVAETVNYIVQRGEILAALGVVAGLAMYVARPLPRRHAWYLVPVVLGLLSKQTAAVFPVLLACYVWIYEGRPWNRDVVVSLVVTALVSLWVVMRTPATAAYVSAQPAAYLLAQPFVAGRYFVSFFAPVWLSVDNDWPLAADIADPMVSIGIAFVAAVIWLAWRARRTPGGQPIAFGLLWFLIAQLPTAIIPLTEVANDHRMFLPFIGLALAVVTLVVQAFRPAATVVQAFRPAGVTAALKGCTTAVIVAVLLAETIGIRMRNEVWRTDEALWRDATVKSPENGRAWMNYGVALMARGDYPGAVDACERALPLAPEYSLLHVNLGVAYGAVGRGADADREFRTAQRLAPDDWRSHVYYARWLAGAGRGDEARRELAQARALNPIAFMNQ